MFNSKVYIWRPAQTTAFSFFYLCAVGLFSAGLISLASGRLSATRIAVLGIVAIFVAGLFSFGWQLQNNFGLATWWHNQTNRKVIGILIAIAMILFLVGWTLAWTPLDSFGRSYYYFQGAYPYIIWLLCSSGAAFVLLLASHFGINIRQWKDHFRQQRTTFIIAGCLFFFFALLAWVASFRVVGVKPTDEDFWYGAGVPILAFQVLSALIVGVGLSATINRWIRYSPSHIFQINLALFLLLWAGSAWLWAIEPVKPDFLVTQPVAPNFEMYPDYDARNYDIMSQFALIGQGINNYSFFDRILYPAFLTYLHTFAGQDYSSLMAIQAALFAILPALLFLIGTSIYNRSAGLVIGILVALRGINHINIGNIIETAHQKQMLTEYPTAILLGLATLLLIKWVQYPTKKWPLAGLAGGVIGISTLLRPHTMVIIPIFFILALLVYRSKARIGLGLGLLFFTTALVSILPWILFGGQKVSIFTLYFTRINVIIQQRYPQLSNPQGWQQNSIVFNSPKTLYQPLSNPEIAPEKSVLAFAADNFLNNLVTSVQSLPTTPLNLEPRVVVKKTENFWKPYWDGNITNWGKIFIPLNLLVLALGLASAWKRARLSGLIPLIIILSYFAINAFGRTSGGRYLVPVDWVILIYYILGLMSVLDLFLTIFVPVNEPVEIQHTISVAVKPWWLSVLSVLLITSIAGSLIPLAQTINYQRFPKRSALEQADLFFSIAGNKLNLSTESLRNFLTSKNAIILTGRSLYPRQFNKDEGLDISIYNFYHSLPYPRTLFTVIGQDGEKVIIFPRTEPAEIPNEIDVMVIGCQAEEFILAWAVIRMDDKIVFERTPPGSPLVCPLPDPVCDNNKSCH